MKKVFILVAMSFFAFNAMAVQNFTSCLMKTEWGEPGQKFEGGEIDGFLQFSSQMEFGCPAMSKIRGSEGLVLNLSGASGDGTSCEYSYLDLDFVNGNIMGGVRMKIYCESNTQPISGHKPE